MQIEYLVGQKQSVRFDSYQIALAFAVLRASVLCSCFVYSWLSHQIIIIIIKMEEFGF